MWRVRPTTPWTSHLLCTSFAAALVATAAAQNRDRSQTPDKYKWNLAEIYPSEAAWRAAKTPAST